jgi:hypothetical protein
MHADHALLAGAVGATEEIAAGLDAVADNTAMAMQATRRQFVDGAFKRIKVMGDAVDNYLHELVVLIAADFTSIHKILLLGNVMRNTW